ncbi:MAG: DUF4347 domain-containing protein, partial [Pseudomonadota bacterium]
DESDTQNTELPPAPLPATRNQELVFVDVSIPDSEQLLAELASQSAAGSLKVIRINAADHGIELIDRALGQYTEVAAIHIISHGTETGIALGADWLDMASARNHTAMFADWQNQLASDADLLLYGCNLAASDAGQELLQFLASTTSADVAASDNYTGHATLNSDWQLEYATGPIETTTPLSDDFQNQWQGRLAVGLLAVDDNLGDVLKDTGIKLDSATEPDTNVLTNDQHTTPDVQLISASGALHGTVEKNLGGEFEYQPDTGYTGTDSFDYIMTDSELPIASHYKLDTSQIEDSTGNTAPTSTNPTTLPTFNTDSYEFDGSDDVIELPDFEYADNFSIYMEFNVGNRTSSDQYLFSHGTGISSNSLQVWIDNDEVKVSVSDTSEGLPDIIAAKYDIGSFSNTGTWVSLLITHTDGDRFRLYVDDNEVSISPLRGGDDVNPAGDIFVGAHHKSDGSPEKFLDTHQIRNLKFFDDVVSRVQANQDIDYSTATVDLNLRDTNQAPVFSNLDANTIFTENGTPATLDNDASVNDPEMSATDNYDGATLTLQRSGGADTQDTFSSFGPVGLLIEGLAFTYTDTVPSTFDVGTVVQNSSGILQLQFNANATQSIVDDVLQSLAYTNDSESPPPSVDIEWTLADNYSGDAEFGSPESATGTTTVTIVEAPDINLVVPAGTSELSEDTTYTYTNAFSFSHDQDPAEPVTVTLNTANGTTSVTAIP